MKMMRLTNVKKALVSVLLLCLFFSSVQVHVNADIGHWTAKVQMPTARYGLGVVAVDGKIYSIGGYINNAYSDVNEEYNPIANEWKTRTNMPTARRFLGVEEVNSRIYAIGGYTATGRTNAVEEYDPVTNLWTIKKGMTIARHFLGVTKLNNRIYAIGGNTATGASNIVEEYDPVANEWKTKTSMPTARYGLGVIAANNRIYAIGGYTDDGRTNLVEEYNPVTDKWTKKTGMPTDRYGFGVAEVNNKIYVIGGSTNSGSTSIVEMYDPVTDQWETMMPLPTGRYFLGAAELNNKIYAIGGFSSISGYQKSNEEYYSPQPQDITIDIEASDYKVDFDTQFEVYARMEGATNIYGADIQIEYDTNLFELTNVQSMNPNIFSIYLSGEQILGQRRYLIASKGINNAINGTTQLLKLTFRVKALRGWGDISVSSGVVSDGEGIEIIPVCKGKTFVIDNYARDVNKDGRFTVADLAITAKLYNTMQEEWGTYYPDVNKSGVIEELDLASVVDSILNKAAFVGVSTAITATTIPDNPSQPTGDGGFIYRDVPYIVSVKRQNDTTISIKLNKDCLNIDSDYNGGFSICEIGNEEKTYKVLSTAQGASASEIILDIEDMSASANAGITIKYSKGNIEDLIGNAFTIDVNGNSISAWDFTTSEE